MKTITIYELMGLIKEDKAPEYIKMGYIKYKKGVGEIEYFDKYGNRLSDMIDFSVLEHEVEILEEEKKIPEKLEYVVSDENGEFSINGFTFDYEQKMQIIDTINQVIDYLKCKGE